MTGLRTTSGQLTEYQISGHKDVAVVGIGEFTTLERSILPATYDRIDPFTDAEFDPPPFRIYDSPAAIVDTVIDSITPENADRVAIVLDRESQYSPLIEAALEAADIPFYGGPGFTDHPDHRAFLQLLRTAHAGSDVRIGDIRPVLTSLGVDVDIEHDEKRLHAVDLPSVRWLTDFCEIVPERTFEEVLSEFETEASAEMENFRAELDTLGLLRANANQSAVSRLEFYLQSYEVPVDRENEGVLLADARAAATVDRPAVFYLGMDEGWTHHSPRRPWVDRDAEYNRNLQQFQRLLQNGRAQYYFVLDERGGRAVTPCLYFEELLEEEFERFSDLDAVKHTRNFRNAGDGFDREPTNVEPETVETVSQSSLNRLVNCPRDQLFNRLVDGPDKDYFAVGNLFHDFAEMYVNHPEQFDEETLERVVDLMLDTTEMFDRDVDRPLNRTEYRIGIDTIVEFLNANRPNEAPFLTSDTGWGRNAVAEELNLDVETPHTEWWFDREELGIKGKVDLVHSEREFVDYKSGSKNSDSKVVRKSALDPPHDTPNFQTLLYLTCHRSEVTNETLEFTFFHFLETVDDVISGGGELDECLMSVTYHPLSFEEYITREAVFEELQEDGPGDCRKTFEQLEYADIVDILVDHPFPDTRNSDELLASDLGDALQTRARDLVGEYKYVTTGCAQALRHFRDIRDSNFFADDLDAFEAFIEERLAELNRYCQGEERFPVEGLGGEPNYRRVDHRDMIFEGDA